MDFYSVWPFLACMVMLYAAAATPLFKWADQPPTNAASRVPQLDGLRGFLALGVVFHHATIYHQYLLKGTWDVIPSGFYTVLGEGSVEVFFMITGFLFWGKVIREQARGTSLDWLALYIGRVFRIGPLYLLATFAMFAVIAVRSRFTLAEPLSALARHVAMWLMLGAGPRVDVNSYADTSTLLAGVTWSLQYEWGFYALLSLAAFLVRPRDWMFVRLRPVLAGLLPAAGLLWCLSQSFAPGYPSRAFCASLFFAGMLCACVRQPPRWPREIMSVLVVTAVTASLTLFSNAYQAGQVVLLGGAFFLVVHGCDVFGILTTRPARRLGDVSYGIYLQQPRERVGVGRDAQERLALLVGQQLSACQGVSPVPQRCMLIMDGSALGDGGLVAAEPKVHFSPILLHMDLDPPKSCVPKARTKPNGTDKTSHADVLLGYTSMGLLPLVVGSRRRLPN